MKLNVRKGGKSGGGSADCSRGWEKLMGEEKVNKKISRAKEGNKRFMKNPEKRGEGGVDSEGIS